MDSRNSYKFDCRTLVQGVTGRAKFQLMWARSSVGVMWESC